MPLITKAFKYREGGSQVTVLATRIYSLNFDSIEEVTSEFVEETSILLTRLEDGFETHDRPCDWNNHVIKAVHEHIIKHWDYMSHNDILIIDRVIKVSVDNREDERS